jgi:uncharacterized membrane protein
MDTSPPFGRGFGGDGVFTYHEGGPGAIGWTVFALQLLLVLGVAWLLVSVFLGSRVGRQRPTATATAGGPVVDDPVGVLRMRYARGELDRDAYLQAASDLGASPGDGGEPGT